MAAAACNEISFMAAPDATEEMHVSARHTAPATIEGRSIFQSRLNLTDRGSNSFRAARVTTFR